MDDEIGFWHLLVRFYHDKNAKVGENRLWGRRVGLFSIRILNSEEKNEEQRVSTKVSLNI